jgi:zinc D-Ala-D-Ala carboxypeptidase
VNWANYPNFTESEFRCRHCGKQEMKPEFMGRLQALRDVYRKPMTITSGYRCPDHPVEKAKAEPGMHSTGLAADVGVQGADAHELMRLAFHLGFTGIGVQQKGAGRFIHLDLRSAPTVWSY